MTNIKKEFPLLLGIYSIDIEEGKFVVSKGVYEEEPDQTFDDLSEAILYVIEKTDTMSDCFPIRYQNYEIEPWMSGEGQVFDLKQDGQIVWGGQQLWLHEAIRELVENCVSHRIPKTIKLPCKINDYLITAHYSLDDKMTGWLLCDPKKVVYHDSMRGLLIDLVKRVTSDLDFKEDSLRSSLEVMRTQLYDKAAELQDLKNRYDSLLKSYKELKADYQEAQTELYILKPYK